MGYHLFMVLFLGTAFAINPDDNSMRDQILSESESPNDEQEEDVRQNKLPLEESQQRLGLIVDKMDEDKDNKVTEKELDNWIVYTQTRYMHDETENAFKKNDVDEDGKLYWDEYNKITFEKNNPELLSKNNSIFLKLKEKNTRKWIKADTNSDGYLTVNEFLAFLHPEEFRHTREIVALETLEEIDTNINGFIDLDEYLEANSFRSEDDEWLKQEREMFSSTRDRNGDGKLDIDKVQNWLLPRDYDHANEEAMYLIYKADIDNDGNLTKEEIIAHHHHDTFVDSQATEWGATLRCHNEF